MHYCSICTFYSVSYIKFTKHIVRHHRHESNFLVNCGINGCQYSTRSWNAFRTHVSRSHSREIETKIPNEDSEGQSESDLDELNIDVEASVYQNMGKYLNAKFFLALKVDHGISERGVMGIIQNTDELLRGSLTLMKNEIKEKMAMHGFDTTILENAKTENLFDGLRTKDQQMKFFQEKCGLIPSELVYLGENMRKIRGSFKQVKKYGYIVPFSRNLEKLISMPELWFWSEIHIHHPPL